MYLSVICNNYFIDMSLQIIWIFLMRFFVFLLFIIMSPFHILDTSFLCAFFLSDTRVTNIFLSR